MFNNGVLPPHILFEDPSPAWLRQPFTLVPSTKLLSGSRFSASMQIVR
jgi:hypothetical protein